MKNSRSIGTMKFLQPIKRLGLVPKHAAFAAVKKTAEQITRSAG